MPIFRFSFATEKESVHIEPVEGIRAYTTLVSERPGVWACDRFCATYEAATTLAEQMALALFTGLKSAATPSQPKVRPHIDLGKVLWETTYEELHKEADGIPVAKLLLRAAPSFDALSPRSQASQRKIAERVVAAATGS